MELETLVQEIKHDIIDTDEVRGSMHYTREAADRDGSPILTFSYKFSQEEAEGFSKYDIGDRDFDEAKANKMETAKSVLEYCFRDELFKIRFLKKSENSARVEIYHEPKSNETPSSGIEDNLELYLRCEEEGLSPEESTDPYSCDRGREEWLKSH